MCHTLKDAFLESSDFNFDLFYFADPENKTQRNSEMEHDSTFDTQHGQGHRVNSMYERVGFVWQMYVINFFMVW